MKKIFILLVVAISVSSCSMDEDMFSCDPDVNQWAKSNLTEIRQMSSADFLEVGDLVYMRAAYNALTPNQRQSLWIEKLENVLKLDWTEKEGQFIESMLEFVKTNSFIFSNKRDPKALEKIEIEYYRWEVYAYEELIWDKNLLGAVVGTPQNLSENKEIISNFNISPIVKTRGEDCECKTGSGDFCMDFFTKCCDKSCKEKPSSCGWFWGQDCNGVCYNPLFC